MAEPYRVVPRERGSCWVLTRKGKPCKREGFWSWTRRSSCNFCGLDAHRDAYLAWKHKQRKITHPKPGRDEGDTK